MKMTIEKALIERREAMRVATRCIEIVKDRYWQWRLGDGTEHFDAIIEEINKEFSLE